MRCSNVLSSHAAPSVLDHAQQVAVTLEDVRKKNVIDICSFSAVSRNVASCSKAVSFPSELPRVQR